MAELKAAARAIKRIRFDTGQSEDDILEVVRSCVLQSRVYCKDPDGGANVRVQRALGVSAYDAKWLLLEVDATNRCGNCGSAG